MFDDYLIYAPEKHGVEIVANYDAYDEAYEFDILLVVREKATGKLYAATDSGCSCPIPFEDHKFPTDFEEITSWEQVKRVLDRAFPLVSGRRSRRNPHDSLRRAVQGALQ